MKQLTTDVITHYVVTYTGVHYPLTSTQELSLKGMTLQDRITLDNNTIFVKNIADILTKEKYEETFPDKQQRGAYQPYTNTEDLPNEGSEYYKSGIKFPIIDGFNPNKKPKEFTQVVNGYPYKFVNYPSFR